MSYQKEIEPLSIDNKNFLYAIELFNNQEWYKAHDAFEEIWHNTNGDERITIQAILQIAVAEVHLSNKNFKGATILYGEGLGRLKSNKNTDLGLDTLSLIKFLEKKLKLLQKGNECEGDLAPKLIKLKGK